MSDILFEAYKRAKDEILDEGDGGGASAGGGAGAGAGAASGGGDAGSGAVAADVSTTTSTDGAIHIDDVLGKCDHKHCGFLGPGCFHIPSRVKVPFHRWEICNGGSKKGKKKRKKLPYLQGAKMIGSYKDLVEAESDAKPIFVFNIQVPQVKEICKQETDNPRFKPEQFMKLVNAKYDDIEYVGLFDRETKACLALAALQYGLAEQDDCNVCEIAALKKGFGKPLLAQIIATQERVWLHANPDADASLQEYYRSPEFGLREHRLEDSVFGKPLVMFYTHDCDEEKLIKFFDEVFTQPKVESIVESMSLDESVASELTDVTKAVKAPADVQKFIDSNEAKFKTALSKMSSEKKPLYQRAWDFLKYAAKKGVEFIKKHWWTILKIIILIALAWISYDWFVKLLKQFDDSAANMLAPGEFLQDYQKKHGEKAFGDGFAHVLNQMNNWD